MKKKVVYWSPCLNPVGTLKATINSAISLSRYDNKNQNSITIINSCGEWDNSAKKLLENKVNLFNLSLSYFKYLPKFGYIKSRFSYLVIFFVSLFPLVKFLKKEKPDFLIIHLITSLPLLIFNIFSFKTKLILRISGYPKLNFLRKFFWKICAKNIYYVTTPTYATLNLIKKNNIFSEKKLRYLPDPILEPKEIQAKKNILVTLSKKFAPKKSLVSIGRLTKQKNYQFLIEAFSEIQKKDNDINLFILGDGDEKNKLLKRIKELDLVDKIFLIGHQENVYNYLKDAKIFILTSLWEDPGFVLLEAGFMNKVVLSSDCPSGPSEILDNGNNGYIYKSNSLTDFIEKYEKIRSEDDKIIIEKKINLKKKCKEFTCFNHYRVFNKILG